MPYGQKSWKHMSIEDAIELSDLTKPKVIILQHFSFRMIKANVYTQAKIVEKKTGIKCIAAKDGQKISLEAENTGLEQFLK